MEIVQIVWLVLVVGFVVLEGATAVLVSIWFCGGALAALIVSLIWPSAIAVQVIVFLVVSGALLACLRPLLKRMRGKSIPTNADANIGKTAQVVVEIQPGRTGRVKLEGLEWAAKSDIVLQVGAWCKVVAIEGVKLVVVPSAQGR